MDFTDRLEIGRSKKISRRTWLRDPHPPVVSHPTPKRMGKNLLYEHFPISQELIAFNSCSHANVLFSF